MTGAVIAENAYLYYANILGGAHILGKSLSPKCKFRIKKAFYSLTRLAFIGF